MSHEDGNGTNGRRRAATGRIGNGFQSVSGRSDRLSQACDDGAAPSAVDYAGALPTDTEVWAPAAVKVISALCSLGAYSMYSAVPLSHLAARCGIPADKIRYALGSLRGAAFIVLFHEREGDAMVCLADCHAVGEYVDFLRGEAAQYQRQAAELNRYADDEMCD